MTYYRYEYSKAKLFDYTDIYTRLLTVIMLLFRVLSLCLFIKEREYVLLLQNLDISIMIVSETIQPRKSSNLLTF